MFTNITSMEILWINVVSEITNREIGFYKNVYFSYCGYCRPKHSVYVVLPEMGIRKQFYLKTINSITYCRWLGKQRSALQVTSLIK